MIPGRVRDTSRERTSPKRTGSATMGDGPVDGKADDGEATSGGGPGFGVGGARLRWYPRALGLARQPALAD